MHTRNNFSVDERAAKVPDWLMILLVVAVLMTPLFLLGD